jgi:hypothetical protein
MLMVSDAQSTHVPAQISTGATPQATNLVNWLRQQVVYSTNFSCENCNNFTSDYVIHNACDEGVFLLFMVTISHNNTAARTAIRQTWASVTTHRGKKIKTIFVLGRNDEKTPNDLILVESKHHRDMVQGDFKDAYCTLTEKVMFGLRWAQDHCGAEYVVKTDDDIFHVPQSYVDYLLDNSLPDMFVGGRCVTTVLHRDEENRAYVSHDTYPFLYSPFYCQGGGYIISQSAVRDIIAIAPHTRYTPLEDQFVSGLCRYTLRIPFFQINGILAKKGPQTQPCTLRTLVKSTHKIYPDEMYVLWERLTARHAQCNCTTNFSVWMLVVVIVLFWGRLLYCLFKEAVFKENVSRMHKCDV